MLTKNEVRDLEKYYGKTRVFCRHDRLKFEITPDQPNGKEMNHIIVISHGNREKHDSGYPFIKIIGVGVDGKFYDLGWHDHYVAYLSTNTDSIGKNIFRVMPWATKEKWVISEHFISVSSFQIGDIYNLLGEKKDREFVELK
jgi:hypothetical protein